MQESTPVEKKDITMRPEAEKLVEIVKKEYRRLKNLNKKVSQAAYEKKKKAKKAEKLARRKNR